MRIVYDDLAEFVETRLRCEFTRGKFMCKYCPFYLRCDTVDCENLHTMCCDILSMRDNPTEERSEGK